MLSSHQMICRERRRFSKAFLDKEGAFGRSLGRAGTMNAVPKLAFRHRRNKTRCITRSLDKRLGRQRPAFHGDKDARIDQVAHGDAAGRFMCSRPASTSAAKAASSCSSRPSAAFRAAKRLLTVPPPAGTGINRNITFAPSGFTKTFSRPSSRLFQVSDGSPASSLGVIVMAYR